MKQLLVCAIIALLSGMTAPANDTPTANRYWPLKELEPFYNAQIERLRTIGYAELFGGDALFDLAFNHEQPSKGIRGYYPESLYVKLAQAAPIWVDAGNIPLLIVVTESYAPYRWQAKQVRIDGIAADTPTFDLTRINDTAEDAPRCYPYLIFNVNMGTDTAHSSIDCVTTDFESSGRRGLTFAEGLALLEQYPDAVKCERDMDEDHRQRFAFGQCVFLESLYGGACADREMEEVIAFAVLENEDDGFVRGYFTHVIRRDMRPNCTRFLFPSCDPNASQQR